MTSDQEQVRKYRRRAQDACDALERAKRDLAETNRFFRCLLLSGAQPSVRPMRKPKQCDHCGEVIEHDEIELELVMGARRWLGAADCEPAEYEQLCPICGGRETFQDAVQCHECCNYPCDCVEKP